MLDPSRQVADPSSAVSLAVGLANYATTHAITSDAAIATARLCFIDALARGFESLRDPECAALIGPLVPGALMPGGARVPGTSLELDPAQAAFCTSLMLCRPTSGSPVEAWHDWRADPVGAILAVADYRGRRAAMEGKPPPQVRDVLAAIVKGFEIQGVLAPEGDRQQARTGTVTLCLARVATSALVTAQLGGTVGQIVIALSYACIDGGVSIDATHDAYGARRADWARADALCRAVRHACQVMAPGHSSYLTSLDLATIDRAGKTLGAKPRAPAKLFGTEVIGGLANLQTAENIAQLTTRFQTAVARYFPARQADRIRALFATPERLDELPVNELLAALVTNGGR